MRQIVVWLGGLVLVFAAAACTAGSGSGALMVSHGQQEYRDSAGWMIKIPPGWHAVPFSDTRNGVTSRGVQVSNIALPPPSLHPTYPIQVSDEALPAKGVGLIIATDADPRLTPQSVESLPLRTPYERDWLVGSAPGGAPYMMTLWFHGDGGTFIADAKIGPAASASSLNAVSAIVGSLH